jgi:hypothetical protein
MNDLLETITPVVLVALFVALSVAYCVGFAKDYAACQKSGGVLVQGIAWYRCVVSAEEHEAES